MDPVSLPVIIVLFAVLNVLAFGIYALDKARARKNSWRISENTLLLLAAFGPFGALFAMLSLRHKTRHLKFLLVPLFLVLQLFLMVWAMQGS